MKKLFLISVIITAISCNKAEVTEESVPYNSSYIYAMVEFSILNDKNEDLLDPENPDHLDEKDINLYYLIDGEKQQVYDPMMDNPENFKIFKYSNGYRIRIFLNFTETAEKPVTYIKWNENDTDTIEAIYERYDNGGIVQQDIWLNDKHIWEIGDHTVDPYFILTK